MTGTHICECGHALRMHHDHRCFACNCNAYARAEDAQAAILAGMNRKRIAIDAANARRQAWNTRGRPHG